MPPLDCRLSATLHNTSNAIANLKHVILQLECQTDKFNLRFVLPRWQATFCLAGANQRNQRSFDSKFDKLHLRQKCFQILITNLRYSNGVKSLDREKLYQNEQQPVKFQFWLLHIYTLTRREQAFEFPSEFESSPHKNTGRWESDLKDSNWRVECSPEQRTCINEIQSNQLHSPSANGWFMSEWEWSNQFQIRSNHTTL